MRDIQEIFESITERFENPTRIGSRCESKTFYRVEELDTEDIATCGEYLTSRIIDVCQPVLPRYIIRLGGSYTELAEILKENLETPTHPIEIISSDKIVPGNGVGNKLKGAHAILVNDVITTARSCVEIHTKATMLGAIVMCWATLIDRTFGPGPVPVIATITGKPVTLLEENL